jgi:mRNA interferase MazF
MNIKRGDVWLANLDPTLGSEIKKTRPVLVVSNNINNIHSSVITVLPITSNVEKVFLFEVFLPAEIGGLPKDSKAKADQIRTIDKLRLIKKIGKINTTKLSLVDIALKVHLGIN